MIIICPCGEKKFTIDENLIPNNGRLLQCGSCDKTWFFNKKDENKKKIDDDKILSNDIEENIDSLSPIKNNETSSIIEHRNLSESTNETNIPIAEEIEIKPIITKNLNNLEANISKPTINNSVKKEVLKNNIGILNYTILFLITFTAFIVLLDTFKHQIEKLIPGTNKVLNSLYESLKDINLFIKDLY